MKEMTAKEIERLLTMTENEHGDVKKKWIVKNIKAVDGLDMDRLEDSLILDVLFNTVKLINTRRAKWAK